MRRYTKGLICLIFLFFIITIFIPSYVSAVTYDSGNLGENIEWSYEYGYLEIKGIGEIPTCEELGIDKYPWSEYKGANVTIQEGITSIPSDCFSSIVYVYLPESMEYIHTFAFTELSSLKIISYSVDCIYDDNAFEFLSEPNGSVTGYDGSTAEKLADKLSLTFSSMGEKLTGSYSDGTLSYYFYDDCAYVAGYVGTSSIVRIPETVEGYTVKGIGGNSFANSRVSEVKMPDTITEIREKAFYFCSSLSSVYFSKNLEFIGNEAFDYCMSLSEAFLPDSVVSIGESAFNECQSLKELYLGSNVSYIGASAFKDCSITSVELPSSLREILPYTFSECHELESVTFPAEIEKINYNAFMYTPVFENLDVPSDTEVIMGECDVKRSSENTVTVPDFVTSMYCNSYYDFQTIIVGKNVREFLVPEYDMSNYNDTLLSEVNISEENPYLCAEDGVVYNKDKTSLLYVAPVHEFENGVMTIPSSVTEIRCVIKNDSITEFAVEEGNVVFSADDGILMNDIEKSVIRYPSGKTDSGYIIPSYVENVYQGAFYGADCGTIIIPDTVKSVEKGAFWKTEPDSIVFMHSESDELDLADDIEGYYTTFFSGETGFIKSETDYYVYDGSPAAAKFPENAVLLDSVQSGKHGSFSWSVQDLTLTITGSGNLTDVSNGIYPWSVHPFTDVVFSGSDIVIPDRLFEESGTLCSLNLSGVTDIGLRSFYGCRYLAEITCHEKIINIENNAFYGTQWIGIPQNETCMNILGEVLVRCTGNPETAIIPEYVKYAAAGAFSSDSAETLYVPETGIIYDSLAFSENTAVQHIRFIGADEDIKLGDFRKAADKCEKVLLVDSKGNEYHGIGYTSDNSLMYLAEALHGTRYMSDMINEYCKDIMSCYGNNPNYSDYQLINMLYNFSQNNLEYGYVYAEIDGGRYAGNERSWELSYYLTHEAAGNAVADTGVCSAYAELVNVYTSLIRETGISKTLVSESATGLNHEWNAVGLEVGTENEKWYYMDLSNGIYLIGYENGVLSSNPDMFSYDAELEPNEDGTYTITLTSGKVINIQSADAEFAEVKGDINGDGSVSIDDATAVLTMYAGIAAGMETTGNTAAADVYGNGTVDIADAVAILTYYAQYSAGMNPDWNELLEAV